MRDDARLGPQKERPEEEKERISKMSEMLVNAAHHVFANGAQRSELKPRYDLIPQVALTRIAQRFEIGLKYGEHNYKKGLPFDDTLNHIIDHLQSYKERRKLYLEHAGNKVEGSPTANLTLEQWMKKSEPDGDDLGAAAWGCVALIWLEANGKLL